MCQVNEPQYVFELPQVPLVNGLRAYVDPEPSGGLDFSHRENENLLFVYFVSQPVSGQSQQRFLFGALVKRQTSQQGDIVLSNSDFMNLGEM